MIPPVDAVLLLSFGGPEGPADVRPFLENVTRGRNVPSARLDQVERHYLDAFGGVSPLNAQCRALRDALQTGLDLPVHWGSRNWHPFVGDVTKDLARAGHRHAVVVTTSAFPSYSGCRQYLEDLERASVPGLRLTKVRSYYAEQGFLDAVRRRVLEASEGLANPRLVFTAHSVPASMNACSGPEGGAYVRALRQASAAVAGDRPWDLVFQSRSGPPTVPWLEPDVSDHLAALDADEVVLVPIGFTSDHVEVVYDLDLLAVPGAPEGMTVRRAGTVGTDPGFVATLVALVQERVAGRAERDDNGGPGTQDRCPPGCCLSR